MTSSRFGVLLVGGLQSHQDGHAACFAADSRCRIVAFADESGVPERREQLDRELADRYGVPYLADLDEALALPGVDIVSMCAEVERRGRVAAACAAAGKALFLDKPLAANLDDARRIVEAVREAGVMTQMYSMTGLPWARAAKECVDSGRIGELRAAHADVLFAKSAAGSAPEGPPRREHERPERFTFIEAKREMFDIGVYAVGLCLWLSGRRAEGVFATTSNYFFEQHASVDVEDFRRRRDDPRRWGCRHRHRWPHWLL